MSRLILSKDEVTGSLLQEVFAYDPYTGIFIHKTNRGPKTDGVGSVAGSLMQIGYITIGLPNGPQVLAHHLAWLWMKGKWPVGEIDHKNRVKTDNRWENLREATRSQNSINGSIRSTNKTGKVGVFFDKWRGKYVAVLGFQNQTPFRKRFDTFEEAVVARDLAERKYFGDFAPCP